MTLIELVMAMLAISVGLAGVLTAFNLAVRSSGDPLAHKQMLAIAEEMMEEILLKPLVPPAGSAGSISGCTRTGADEIGDYGGYSDQPVCDIDGTAVGSLTGYTVSVSVDAAVPLSGVAATRIVVTVRYGGESISLTGYRTPWAS